MLTRKPWSSRPRRYISATDRSSSTRITDLLLRPSAACGTIKDPPTSLMQRLELIGATRRIGEDGGAHPAYATGPPVRTSFLGKASRGSVRTSTILRQLLSVKAASRVDTCAESLQYSDRTAGLHSVGGTIGERR